MADVEVHDEIKLEAGDSGWRLCFQRGTYHYEDGRSEEGYRFIYRDPDGNLRPQRGQARIDSVGQILQLLGMASAEGWV